MTTFEQNLKIAKRYLSMLERGVDSAELHKVLHTNILQQEFPNTLTINGATRDLAQMLEGHERGQQVIVQQSFEITNAFGSKNQLVLEMCWRGTLAISIGNLSKGDVMVAYIASILEFEENLIITQRNYDCFEPFK
ncbi:MAG: nuclear transport factor 2 family protein [Candidatus Promineifilaceae bacterium]